MARLLLRLLLIVSLVTNGVAAPWAMAHPAKGSGHDHAAMVAQASSDEASAGSDCHHGASHGDHAGSMGHAAPEADTPTAPVDRSCCDGPNCTCGCMLPPVLARFALNLRVPTWSAAPVVVPATRAGVRRAMPLLRPPAV